MAAVAFGAVLAVEDLFPVEVFRGSPRAHESGGGRELIAGLQAGLELGESRRRVWKEAGGFSRLNLTMQICRSLHALFPLY